MSDVENMSGGTTDKGHTSNNEASASKLWAVYVSEAEKYDKSLVESWKSDMEGMLIFSGLFSATLTAFIIESYKTLVPDTGDSTVHLLTQISQQLAAASNGSAFQPAVQSTSFVPPATSLVCNALWFISLGLSLTCALVATLLEQWARDFLHRTDMRSSPVIRARMFSLLYYGLKRFGMHTVVDIIPLLLHSSLVLFFAGLVAFLIPINVAIAVIAATILVIVVGVYSLLTVLPIWYMDCPYRTPLSNTCWFASQRILNVWRRWQKPLDGPRVYHRTRSITPTIVQAMEQHAMEDLGAQRTRDERALVWTIKSLADDDELEPFVEGIPDAVWGPDRMHRAYADYVRVLIDTHDLQLIRRIERLFRSCDAGLLSAEDSRRRRVTCFKALWAMGSLLGVSSFPTEPQSVESVYSWKTRRTNIDDSDRWMLHYSISIDALMRWSTFRLHLAQCEVDVKGGRLPSHALSRLESLIQEAQMLGFLPPAIEDALWRSLDKSTGSAAQFIQATREFHTVVSHLILFNYLELCAGSLDSLPYQWDNTLAMITPERIDLALFPILTGPLENSLSRVVYTQLDRMNSGRDGDVGWIDTIILKLGHLWRPAESRCIPSAIIHYLNAQKDDAVFSALLYPTDLGVQLWHSIPITLSVALGASTRESRFSRPVALDEVMCALWRIASLGSGPPASVYEAVMSALLQAKASQRMLSVVAMVRTAVLRNLLIPGPGIFPFRHKLLPTDTAIVVPAEVLDVSEVTTESRDLLNKRVSEATVALLAEFLEDCSPAPFPYPYRADETLRFMGSPAPRGQIHARHQIRLAQSMHRLSTHHAYWLASLVQCEIFDIYAGTVTPDSRSLPSPDLRHAWLEDSTARACVTDTLVGCARDLRPDLRRRAIIQGVGLLHGT
ncbi:hypothetical protein GGX14DRAFT_186736 [Mycena pura]|uniref:DUF6535 domain-containing protein n=1 Tax=Mycena pura TaxID=153505 RepID=A0AAD6V1P2_9AGAR|nr:hypothetical protein GGX14DRAFT_186736 [Mycena pura]